MMHPKSNFQESSVRSSSISPNGLGGNTSAGTSCSKYAGPHARGLPGGGSVAVSSRACGLLDVI